MFVEVETPAAAENKQKILNLITLYLKNIILFLAVFLQNKISYFAFIQHVAMTRHVKIVGSFECVSLTCEGHGAIPFECNRLNDLIRSRCLYKKDSPREGGQQT